MLTLAFNVQPITADPDGLLLFETDKSVYALGEPVKITLTNIGEVYVEIGGWPCCEISTYPDLEHVWPEYFALLLWGLAPGESETWIWDQINPYTERPAEPGKYIVQFAGVLYTPSEVNDAFFEISDEIDIHDVAVVDVTPSKTVVGQGYSMSINVTVENKRNYTETFNVTVYTNTTAVETREITLTNGSSTTLPSLGILMALLRANTL